MAMSNTYAWTACQLLQFIEQLVLLRALIEAEEWVISTELLLYGKSNQMQHLRRQKETASASPSIINSIHSSYLLQMALGEGATARVQRSIYDYCDDGKEHIALQDVGHGAVGSETD